MGTLGGKVAMGTTKRMAMETPRQVAMGTLGGKVALGTAGGRVAMGITRRVAMVTPVGGQPWGPLGWRATMGNLGWQGSHGDRR